MSNDEALAEFDEYVRQLGYTVVSKMIRDIFSQHEEKIPSVMKRFEFRVSFTMGGVNEVSPHFIIGDVVVQQIGAKP